MIFLRAAVVDDAVRLGEVHQLARSAYFGAAGFSPDPNSHGSTADRVLLWANYIPRLETSVTCAVIDGRVAGFACSRADRDFRPSASELELVALYVDPRWWGTGVGSALHTQFCVELDAHPGAVGTLTVWDRNDRAKAFYLRQGWQLMAAVRPGPMDSPFVEMRLSR